MKFKQLGTFAVLAVCLFAIVIVMGGCGTDNNGKGTDPIKPPPPPPPVETPMEKLTGEYTFVEEHLIENNGELGVWINRPVSGRMILRPGGNGWVKTYEHEEGDSSGTSGPTWRADSTTIAFTTSGNDTDFWVDEYTLQGKLLTLINLGEEFSFWEKWRKD